jgi:phage-related protein
MVLLHGYIKKAQKAPPQELEVARDRKKLWLSG